MLLILLVDVLVRILRVCVGFFHHLVLTMAVALDFPEAENVEFLGRFALLNRFNLRVICHIPCLKGAKTWRLAEAQEIA